MSNPAVIDITALRQAIEQRNAETVINMYDDDAVMEVVDHLHPPSSPMEIRGKHAIREFLNGIFSRDMTHEMRDEIYNDDRLSFFEACQYPGGERVLVATTLELKDGKIAHQTTIQAWDE